MKNTFKFALVGAFLAVAAPASIAANAQAAAKRVEAAVKASPSTVLAVVKNEIAKDSGNACEIVKAAIVATEADKKLVAKIVDTAIATAPKKQNLIVACALAIAPDAHANVMAVSAKYNDGGDDETNNLLGDKSNSGKPGGANGNGPGGFIDALDNIGLDANGNFSGTETILPPTNGGGGTLPPEGGSN